jgi:ribulose 1,5-bisphosphate carboxylase large subunit-like protein
MYAVYISVADPGLTKGGCKCDHIVNVTDEIKLSNRRNTQFQTAADSTALMINVCCIGFRGISIIKREMQM